MSFVKGLGVNLKNLVIANKYSIIIIIYKIIYFKGIKLRFLKINGIYVTVKCVCIAYISFNYLELICIID